MGEYPSIIDATMNGDIMEIINRGLAYAIIIAGFLSVIFVFIGGFSFILSGGSEDKVKTAVGTIRYALIGLAITLLAVVIVQSAGRLIGIDVIRYINFRDIINTVMAIGQYGNTSSITH